MKTNEKDNPPTNLWNDEAIEKLKELATKEITCLFTTNLGELPLTARPMATQQVDDQGNLWFLSRDDSDKNSEIQGDNRVQLFYSNKGNAEFLSVYGRASISKDRQKIEELWTPIAKAWFEDGKDDTAISVIKVIPEDVYYWDTKYNKVITLMKIAASAVTGKNMDDGLEGKLNVQ
jgi:general stress protein 26